MKKNLAKVAVVALTSAMFVGVLTSCGNGNGKTKIGVLVADASGAEALSFRNYYENYIEKNYNVDFVYSTEIGDDTTKEMEELDKLLAENCKAIISFASCDRPAQIEKCEASNVYYTVATGTLSDENYDKYKSYSHFLGQIGPSTYTEYQVGYEMGTYYKSLTGDDAVDNIALYVGFPDPAHVARFSGIITGLGMTYSGFGQSLSGMDIVGAVYGQDNGTPKLDNIQTGESNIKVSTVLSFAPGAGLDDGLNAMLNAEEKPDALLGVGMVSVFMAAQLNQKNIPYSDVDAFTAANKTNFTEGSMQYLAGKYGSSVGPVFALVINALNGNVIRNDEGNAVSLDQGYMVAKSVEEFNTNYDKETGNSPIYNKEVLDTIIGKDVTYKQVADLVASK